MIPSKPPKFSAPAARINQTLTLCSLFAIVVSTSEAFTQCHIEFVNEVVTAVQNDDMRIDRVMTTMWYSFAEWIDQITVTLPHGHTKVVVCTTITFGRLVKSLDDLVCFR